MGLQSVHYTLPLPPLPSQGEDSSSAPAWGLSRRRQSSMNFSILSPSHRLQFFMNCPSVGPSHLSLGTGCSSVGPPWGPASKPAPVWSSHSMCPQVLAETCSSLDSPQDHIFLRTYISSMGSSTGFRRISAPPWTSLGCRGTTCLTMVFIVSCKGRLSSLVPGAPPPLSFFSDWGVCRVIPLASSHSSLLTAVPQQVLPLLKYVIPEALPPSLLGLLLGSGRSILEPPGTGSVRHGGSFLQLLIESIPIAPPTTRTLPCKPTSRWLLCSRDDVWYAWC